MRICSIVLRSLHSHSWESCGIWNLSNHSLLEPWPVRSRVMILKMWRGSFRMICLVIKTGTVKLNWASGTILRYHSCFPLSPVLYWFFHFSCNFPAFVCFTTLVCYQKFSTFYRTLFYHCHSARRQVRFHRNFWFTQVLHVVAYWRFFVSNSREIPHRMLSV